MILHLITRNKNCIIRKPQITLSIEQMPPSFVNQKKKEREEPTTATHSNSYVNFIASARSFLKLFSLPRPLAHTNPSTHRARVFCACVFLLPWDCFSQPFSFLFHYLCLHTTVSQRRRRRKTACICVRTLLRFTLIMSLY
jgi:hypothetical protein